jgi:proteasome lid subunit RPN8/RPN11
MTFDDVMTTTDLTSPWLDPHILITPQHYGKIHPKIPSLKSLHQPFQVIVHPQVQLLCDLHSHLCDAEIIGFLAGKYDAHTKVLYIQACFPCNSLERPDDGATDVEMDPIAELSVREVILKYNLEVVGWYHSHPLFRPDPSTTDIINQHQYQQLFQHSSCATCPGHSSPPSPSSCSSTTSTVDEVIAATATAVASQPPFVGLIVSTCDPDLPNFESLHQWFHTIPLPSAQPSATAPPGVAAEVAAAAAGETTPTVNTDISSCSSISSSSSTTRQSKRQSKRRNGEIMTETDESEGGLSVGFGVGTTTPMAMRIEILTAHVKEIHRSEGLINSSLDSKKSQLLQQKLFQLRKQDFGDEIRGSGEVGVMKENEMVGICPQDDDDDCVFVKSSPGPPPPVITTDHHSTNSQTSSPIPKKRGRKRKTPISESDIQEAGALTVETIELMDGINELSEPMNAIDGATVNIAKEEKPSVLISVSVASDISSSDFLLIPPSEHFPCASDPIPSDPIPFDVTSDGVISNPVKGLKKIKSRLNATESLLTIRQPERITRSRAKKLSEIELKQHDPTPRKPGRPRLVKPIDPLPILDHAHLDEAKNIDSSIDTSTNPPTETVLLVSHTDMRVFADPPMSVPTSVVVPQLPTVPPPPPSPVVLPPSPPKEPSIISTKRVRKESLKKATDATKYIGHHLHSTDTLLSQPSSSEMTSSSLTLSSSPLPSTPFSSELSFPSSSPEFYSYFQSQTLSSSALARSILCSSPLLLRYTSLCTIALGYYYCSYHRRTNLTKKFKTDFKFNKIKSSLMVWIRYFGMSEKEQENYLEQLITFLKHCWVGT